MNTNLEVDEEYEIYGRCLLCAVNLKQLSILPQKCMTCSDFGLVKVGGTRMLPIPFSELFPDGKQTDKYWYMLPSLNPIISKNKK